MTSLRCPVCDGYKEPGFTTFTADLGENLVVVRHVPATICHQCGEEWIDNKIAQQLETIVEEARAQKHRGSIFLSINQHSIQSVIYTTLAAR